MERTRLYEIQIMTKTPIRKSINHQKKKKKIIGVFSISSRVCVQYRNFKKNAKNKERRAQCQIINLPEKQRGSSQSFGRSFLAVVQYDQRIWLFFSKREMRVRSCIRGYNPDIMVKIRGYK